jgi:condensin complex subunit 1
MIELVWSKEAGVKQALWDAFRDLYLTAPRTGGASPKSNIASLYIACKLISLTFSATLAELTSLEQLLSEMKQQDLIPAAVVQTLLDIFGTIARSMQPTEAKHSSCYFDN